MYSLEEPPIPERRQPIRHSSRPNDKPRPKDKPGPKEPAGPPPHDASGPPRRDPADAPDRPWLRTALWLAVGAAAVSGAGLWIDHRISRIERDVGQAIVRLEDAGSSLRLLWTTTTRLDATRSERQDLLQDSITFVRNFVETELNKLWSSAYAEHERRLNLTDERIAGNNRSIRQILDASGRTNTRLDLLLAQNHSLESDLRSVSETALALRQTLIRLTDQLGSLESQINNSRAVQAQMDGRVGGVERWVEEFRGEGLNAANMRGRLASIAADLRMVSLRVDSLRTPGPPRRVGTQ
jgi:hypothetical protein